jgi:tetratricopeptide (TPR) repeat protein
MKIHATLDDRFEEIPTDPDALPAAIDAARRDLDLARHLLADRAHPDALGILGRELVQLAQLLALSSDLDAADAAFTEAIDAWRDLRRARPAWLTRLRRAAVWRRRGDLDAALTELDDLLDLTKDPALAMYEDFACFQRALTAARAGRIELARADLHRALTLRQQRGAQAPIDEARRALLALP